MARNFQAGTVRGNTGCGSVIEGRFGYTVRIKPIFLGAPKQAPALAEIENRTPYSDKRSPGVFRSGRIRTDGAITDRSDAFS